MHKETATGPGTHAGLLGSYPAVSVVTSIQATVFWKENCSPPIPGRWHINNHQNNPILHHGVAESQQTIWGNLGGSDGDLTDRLAAAARNHLEPHILWAGGGP
jgi:hypothetical protein